MLITKEKFSRILLATLCGFSPALLAAPVMTDHLDVELVSEQSALVPGAAAWLGLRLQHAPQWHTYWINPGDSGLPTRLTWTLPTGYAVAGEVAWPVPKRFDVDGLANFGYDAEVLLPIPIKLPPDAKTGTTAHLSVAARWLVCHEECVPGKATLSLDLPVAASAGPDPNQRAAFRLARAALPENGMWIAAAKVVGEQVEISVRGADLGNGAGIDAYAEQTKVVANAPPQVVLRNGMPVLIFAKSDYFTSIPAALDLVVVRTSARAMRLHAPFAASPVTTLPALP